jgi:hypothetical protein
MAATEVLEEIIEECAKKMGYESLKKEAILSFV